AATKEQLGKFLAENVALESNLYTDDHPTYPKISDGYHHQTVRHSAKQYVDGMAHTNAVESFWALLKRGHYGIFHHFSVKHLHRYLAEFEARWNMSKFNSENRLDLMLESASGLRLTYESLIAE